MDTFNTESVLSRLFGRLELGSMVEARGSYEGAVGRVGGEKRKKPNTGGR